MIVLLAILAAIYAFPVGIRGFPILSLDQLQAPICDSDGCRSFGAILRSCVVTVLLFTWFSAHPNIPSPDERWPRIASGRVKIMLVTLIAPEAIIVWAWKQRQLAIRLAEKHKGEGWTTAHGFFAIMGGFIEYEGERPIRVLLPEQLESYSLTGNGDFPRISKAEIEDKSKGDAIAKVFVILQTGWFVAHSITRGVHGLPMTELEFVSLAFVALNLIIYVLWWDKPQSVQYGVRVYKKRKADESGVNDRDVKLPLDFGSHDERDYPSFQPRLSEKLSIA